MKIGCAVSLIIEKILFLANFLRDCFCAYAWEEIKAMWFEGKVKRPPLPDESREGGFVYLSTYFVIKFQRAFCIIELDSVIVFSWASLLKFSNFNLVNASGFISQ